MSQHIIADDYNICLPFTQLLNALFGLNTAAQHTHLYSPYISSLPYNLVTQEGLVNIPVVGFTGVIVLTTSCSSCLKLCNIVL